MTMTTEQPDVPAAIHRLTLRYAVNAAQALAPRLAAELPADRVQVCTEEVTRNLEEMRPGGA